MKEKLILVVKLIKQNILILWNNLDFRLSFFGIICAFLGLLSAKLTPLSLCLYILGYIPLFTKIFMKTIRQKKYYEILFQNLITLFITAFIFVIGYHFESIIVLTFFYLNEVLKRKLTCKLNVFLNPKKIFTNLVVENKTHKIPIKNIKTNDIIIVKVGEIIPVNGVITDGRSSIDSFHIKGCHDKLLVSVYDHVRSGWVNLDGILKIQVTEDFNESALYQIDQILQNNVENKTKTETLALKLDFYYPIVLGLVCLVLFLIFNIFLKQDMMMWFYRLFTVLLIIQPGCFFRIVNLIYYTTFQKLIQRGIFIKSKQQIDNISDIDTFIFDIHGTLTKNNYNIVKIVPNKDVDQKDLLEMLCYGIYYSSEPIYRDILRDSSIKINNSLLSNYQEYGDKNVKVVLNNRELIIGQRDYLIENNYHIKKNKERRETIHIGYDHEYLGYMVIGDQIKDDSKKVISDLEKMGINNIALLSSNDRSTIKELAEQLGVTDYQYSLSLTKKKEYVKRLNNSFQAKGKSAYVVIRNNIDKELTVADLNFVFDDTNQNLVLDDNREINITANTPMTIIDCLNIIKIMRLLLIINFIVWLLLQIVFSILGLLGIVKMWQVAILNVFLNLGVIFTNLCYLKKASIQNK